MYQQNCDIDKKLWHITASLYQKLKEHYLFHPNLPILWQSVTNYWDTLYFRKSQKIFDLFKDTQDCACSLTKCLPIPKSFSKQCRPGMNKQTCNQHWIRREMLQVSQFTSLIVSKIKINWKIIFKDPEYISKKWPILMRGLYSHA